jgi:hypothetical protein
MARYATLTLAAAGLAVTVTAAVTPGAAEQPPSIAQAQPGLWEISGAPGANAPSRQCVADIAALARFEHRAKSCAAKVLKNSGSMTSIEYSCGGAGFGHSEIQTITPRSLRISTQGISDGLPFNYVLQAHRIDDCPKNAAVTRH